MIDPLIKKKQNKTKQNKTHIKVKQLKAVLLANEEFHEMEVNTYKIMVYRVTDLYIWFPVTNR